MLFVRSLYRRPYLMAFGAIMGVTALACEGELETNFGPPGGLTGATLPPANLSDAGGTMTKHDGGTMKKCVFKTTKDSGTMDTGSTDAPSDTAAAEGGAGTEEAGTPEASDTPEAGDTDSGPPPVTDACKVTWTKDIQPNMTAGGKWACGNASCHGSGAFSPALGGSATDYYNTLVATSDMLATPALPFILPCSTNPAKSAFVCNVSGDSCGSQMPPLGNSVGAAEFSKSDIAMIKTWIACGAQDD
jgi:hypothetical protein